MYQELSYLLIVSCLLNIIEYYIGTNKRNQKLQVLILPGFIFFAFPSSFVFRYFNSNILYSVDLFGIRWFFAVDMFSNVLFQTLISFENTYLIGC